MKWKQRVIGFVAALCGLMFIGTYRTAFLLSNPSPILDKTDGQNFAVPEDVDFEDPKNGSKLETDDFANKMAAIKSHLSVMRHDLDMSNFTSSGSKNLTATGLHDRLKQIVLKDEMFQQNAQDIVEIANILQETGKIKTSEKHQVDKNEQSNPDIELERKDQANRVKSKEDVPMHILAFPVHNRHDEAMLHYQLPKYVFEELEAHVQKETANKKKPHTKKGIGLRVYPSKNLYPWQVWHNHISQFALYSPDDPAFLQVLEHLSKAPITDLYQHDGGTQIKLVFYLEDEFRTIFKPMRYPREQETLPDHFYFSDFERHNAEIAAFNLDMALGFYRVPPVVGRKINVTYDVKRHADKELLKTFFISPAGNICFHGQCDYYCDTGHAVCGHPELMEGSMMAYLPTSIKVPRETWKHPWRRSYHKRKRADWEDDPDYCNKRVRNEPPFNSGRRLLDIMDMAVFDFLTGNMDRHHYETFKPFGNFTFTLMYDNGRGFGKSRHDEMSILAPIYQCCLFRFSTLQKLLQFYKGPKHLSDIMRENMANDIATPVLLEPHLIALDRRVKLILKTVHKCVEKNGFTNVIRDDGF